MTVTQITAVDVRMSDRRVYTFYNFICLNVSLVILTIKEVLTIKACIVILLFTLHVECSQFLTVASYMF